ncbi:uncharacterized protein LOC134762777 [Penaeus indicus]|uniref:uncharacterized protein LOC134762777 n=1 Tax=Penaeus indicus TaxID=29960 RepID=UPI00300D1233
MEKLYREWQGRKPDIVYLNKKKKEAKIIDIAIPGDTRVKEKKPKKNEKYQPLKDEIARLWKWKKFKIIPVVIGAPGVVSKKSEGYIKECDEGIRLEIIIIKNTTAGTSRILRKYWQQKEKDKLETCEDLLSPATTEHKN